MCLTVLSCRNVEVLDDLNLEGGYNSELTPDWTEKTHSNNVEPDYTMVFPQDKIVQLHLKIEAEDWTTMQSNLEEIKSSSGGAPGQFSNESPAWIPCSVIFNNTEWYQVGIRYKGNSSLFSVNGNKYSFKLDFDEFETDYPEITNQRFYGFKQLNLKNNFKDASLMHEKVASELFQEFGIECAQTSFCQLYIDHGEGSLYYGLYTLTEEVDDTMLKNQFGTETGNLYKPDNNAARFSRGTYSEGDYMKKNNQELNDYSDVKALYDVINNSTRTSNPQQWQDHLESVFDVDHFLKWLAANTAMQNWDTYGNMGHNYYLYNNPLNNKLTWIPWDNNEALSNGQQNENNNKSNFPGPGPGGGGHTPLSLSLDEVTSDWPLINYIIAIDEYKTTYQQYLEEFMNEVFKPAKMIAKYSSYYNLIRTAVYEEETNYTFLSSSSEFDTAVDALKSHVQSRQDAVITYLKNN